MALKTKKNPLGLKKESRPTAGSGNFAKVAGAIAKSAMKAGKSPAVAKRIGGAVTANQGVKKFGQKAMTKAAVKGRAMSEGKADMAKDKKMGIKEGSKRDMKMDKPKKSAMKDQYGKPVKTLKIPR